LKDSNQLYSRISFFSEGYSSDSFFLDPKEIKLENYDYVIFSHFDKSNAIYLTVIQSGLFVPFNSQGPSLVFIRNK
jgi:hypothetical protein